MSTRSRCEWSNLVLVKLVKLKGLESIQLDVVKVAGDAFLGFFLGDAAQTTNGKQPKILPLPPRMKVDLACSKNSNIFQAKVLKADSQNHPGFVWHGFGMLGLNVLISTSSQRSEV